MNKEEYQYQRECLGGLRLISITVIAFSITVILTIMMVWNRDTPQIYQPVEPPSLKEDLEVISLQERFKDYDIQVHRINPANAEHQRRYHRHLANL
jgi:hypothetical protein